MYDAIVVGARCPGSATAFLLARKGYRVLLVDKATFPSDTINGHFVLHRGTLCLKRWGLLDRVLTSNCPAITRISTDFGDFPLSGELAWRDGAPPAVGPRRTVLDSILVNAAVEAGAELREGFAVTDLMREDTRVVGIRGQSRGNAVVKEHAKIVIGADGKHSRIAQLVESPQYNEVPSLTCWYYSYWSGLPCDGLEINWRHHQVVLTFPTNDNLVICGIGVPQADFQQFRSDVEGNYLTAIARIPQLAERIHNAHREARFLGMADVPNFLRKPYGPGWALVGDASHHKDPTPAHGISDAFHNAELLAEAVHKGLSGELPMDNALAQYQHSRDAHAIPEHEAAQQGAHLEHWDSPDALGLRAALRGNAADTADYLGTFVLMASPEEFYSPANLQRIMAKANPDALGTMPASRP